MNTLMKTENEIDLLRKQAELERRDDEFLKRKRKRYKCKRKAVTVRRTIRQLINCSL